MKFMSEPKFSLVYVSVLVLVYPLYFRIISELLHQFHLDHQLGAKEPTQLIEGSLSGWDIDSAFMSYLIDRDFSWDEIQDMLKIIFAHKRFNSSYSKSHTKRMYDRNKEHKNSRSVGFFFSSDKKLVM